MLARLQYYEHTFPKTRAYTGVWTESELRTAVDVPVRPVGHVTTFAGSFHRDAWQKASAVLPVLDAVIPLNVFQ